MFFPGLTSFKSTFGKYLSAHLDGTVDCHAGAIGRDETFAILPGTAGYSLRAQNGMYLCAESYLSIVTNRAHVGECATFTMFYVNPLAGKGVLRTTHGGFISAQAAGAITGDASTPGDAQTFEVREVVARDSQSPAPPAAQFAGGGKHLLSFHGKFLSAARNGTLDWNCGHARGWETFEFIHVRGDVYNIKSFHGGFLCGEPGGRVVADKAVARGWEAISVEPLPENRFALKTSHGKYISAQPNGTVEGNRTAIGQWEIFSFA
jgi:hypothetical protein